MIVVGVADALPMSDSQRPSEIVSNQRKLRGWADEDVRDLDNYLACSIGIRTTMTFSPPTIRPRRPDLPLRIELRLG